MKSMFRIVAILVIVLLSIAAANAWSLFSSDTPPSPAPQTGRYQIFFSPHMRADTFLVDTVEGKVWQLTTYADLVGDPQGWGHLERIDNDAQMAAFYASNILKPPAAMPKRP